MKHLSDKMLVIDMLDGEPDITIEEKQWEIEKIKRLNMTTKIKINPKNYKKCPDKVSNKLR